MALKKIGGRNFIVNPLLAEASFDLQPKLLPVIPEMAKLYLLFTQKFEELVRKGKETIETKEAIDAGFDLLEQASPSIAKLCSTLGPDELQHIRRTLLAGASCDGTVLYNSTNPAGPHPIDHLMMGRTLEMWELLIFAVRVSYPDFFDRLGALGAPKKAEVVDDSET